VPEVPSLTQDEFRRLCEFLYRRTGMIFTEAKRYYVERRVVDRMVDRP
jgi:chemotaxis protein methyltransferase CheR